MRQPNTSAHRVQDSRWTRLPDHLISALSPREHQLVHALLSYRWTDQAAIYPRVGVLADTLGWSARTVQRTLRALERGGWIVSVARYRDDGGRTSNEYRPGPMLLPLLARRREQVVTSPRPTWPAEREPRKQDPKKKDAFRVYTDPYAHTAGALGHLIRT